jgi:signal transduction histidine kinase
MFRDNRHMGLDARYSVALVLGALLTVVATVWTISVSEDRIGLSTYDLLQVEPLPDRSESVEADHLHRFIEARTGERPWTDDDIAERFAPKLQLALDAEFLNDQIEGIQAAIGQLSVTSLLIDEPEVAGVVAVGETGVPILLLLEFSDGRISGLNGIFLPQPPPLRGWASALMLGAAWLFLAVGAATRRVEQGSRAWLLLCASLVAAAMVLVLSRAEPAYTLGRVAPAMVVLVAIGLLLRGSTGRSAVWIWALAIAGAALAAAAPFARDATIVGHPSLVAQFVDDESLYRALLTSSAVLVGAAMAGVAALNISDGVRVSRWRRPVRWGAAAVAVVWAGASFGSAIDSAIGVGAWAGGSLLAGWLFAFAAVPVVMALGLLTARWDNAGLANLVIDLDAENSDLEQAVANALEDPSIRLVTSDDGVTLRDDAGHVVDPDCVPAGRTVTQIRSHGTLVGGVEHDAALQTHPMRVEAVAAAAGLAIEVGRLNRQVLAQLDDVTASRARIVESSDAARHRVERDLHDGAQQRLVGLGLTLQRARRLDGADLDVVLADATSEVRGITEDIRRVARGSHPALLAERGLPAALDALVERTPVPVRLDVAGDEPPSATAATVYFVVSEALTNVAKHAHATTASVCVASRNGSAVVRVADDGCGGAAVTPGSGLQGLDDRVAAAGGSLRIDSDRSGTTLEATIPCE